MWLLKSVEDSKRPSTSVESSIDWLANRILPWTAYQAFMSGHLIALGKQPGFRLVGVGKTWRRFFAYCVLRGTGTEANITCQDDQIFTAIKVGIDGSVQGVQNIWDT